MKKILLLTILAVLHLHATDWKTVNQEAARIAARPVKPGIPGVSPFWNIKAKAFIHPPAFSFKGNREATSYRFTVTEKTDGKRHTFDAKEPWAPMTPVWTKIRPGYVTVTVQGRKADGTIIGEVQQRECYRAAVFKGPYPSPEKTDYAAAAHRCYESVYRLPYVQGWLTQTTPPEGYDLYCYPSKILTSMIDALLRYAPNAPQDDAAKAMRIACRMADWLLSQCQPAGTPLEYLPPTYWGNRRNVSVRYAGMNMLLYPPGVANVLFSLAEKSGNKKYRDAAVRIATTMRRLQLPNGTWYLKVYEKNGAPVRKNLIVNRSDFDRCFITAAAATGDKSFLTVMKRARGYVLNNTYKTWNWDGQFEDMDPLPAYHNLTKNHSCDLASTLFAQGKIREAEELLHWSEDQFVVWSDPIHNMDWRNWKMPTALEQYEYYTPIDASMANFIITFADAYKATGKAVHLEKAKALANCILRHQRADGTIPTYFDNRKGSDWVNCMIATSIALEHLNTIKP